MCMKKMSIYELKVSQIAPFDSDFQKNYGGASPRTPLAGDRPARRSQISPRSTRRSLPSLFSYTYIALYISCYIYRGIYNAIQ